MKNLTRMMQTLALATVLLFGFSSYTHAQIETGENVMVSASQFGQIQYFRTLLEETGLDEELNEEGPFTLLAPTDQAFEDIPEAELQALLEDPDALREVLRAHIIPEALKAGDFGNRDDVTTLQGAEFDVSHHERGISVDGALMVAADIVATNGVIHAIDKVLMP